MKYVLVSGGVISGIGKGTIETGFSFFRWSSPQDIWFENTHVTSIKIDPYLNIDAGTMAPTEHGEVFVLDDGGEADLDLGNYERYLDVTLRRENNITTGKIYLSVIEAERRGDFLGKTVQVVPHITNAVQDWIEAVAKKPVDDSNETPDVCIIELGGTVGDIESTMFIEAMRQLKRRVGKNNFMQIHVTLIPVINGEQKTKLTQHAYADIGRAGLFPDLIACRCDVPLERAAIEKIAMYCQVEPEQVVAVHNVTTTYHVPLLLERQGLLKICRDILKLDDIHKSKTLIDRGQRTWTEWKALTSQQERLFDTVNIALVGKYTNLHDSYLSVIKALEHSAMHCGKMLQLTWVDASHLEDESKVDNPAEFHKAWTSICTASGILVPGGFGHRGTEGMVQAARWARQNKTPYLGICLGMQIAVIEFARNVCALPGANSVELHEHCPDPVVIFMPEIDKHNLGGTMRLGLRPTRFQPGSEWSRLRKLYGKKREIHERHRHRYEVNPDYIERLSKSGLDFVGKDDKGVRMEVLELKNHPYFVGVQFHPEYLSRVLHPSKPYLGFVAAAAGILEKITANVARQEQGLNGVNGSAKDDVNDCLSNGMNGVQI